MQVPLKLGSLTDIKTWAHDDIIDVRSPAEYAEDHIPGAINLPALNNEERALVGEMYVQKSAFKARKIGAALVARNAARHLEKTLIDKPGEWRPLVYCWRGGQRSGSFASILSQIGWRADVLDGGYRSYRNAVVDMLYNQPLKQSVMLIDGNTGTGKTDILQQLNEYGAQVADLEGLALHRGSLFGALNEDQPSQKAFESKLAGVLCELECGGRLFLEAESSKVGERLIPKAVWDAMKSAPRINITAPVEARAAYLVTRYSDLIGDGARLQEIISKLARLHSKERIKHWKELVETHAFTELASELIQFHYDPRYRQQPSQIAYSIELEDLNEHTLNEAATNILKQVN